MTDKFILTSAFVLSEYSPVIQDWLRSDNAANYSLKVLEIAKNVTKKEEIQEILRVFREDSQKITIFQEAISAINEPIKKTYAENSKLKDLLLFNSNKKNNRADIMIISAALGLIFCLGILTFNKGAISGEAIGMISTIAGIFGSCFKDAYGFEFGSSRGSKEKDDRVTAALLGKH